MLLVDRDDWEPWFNALIAKPRVFQYVFALLEARRYRASDTGLSRRQLATLDSDKLLSSLRDGTRGWRRFSFIELVYMGIVFQVMAFGLWHSQLTYLWKAFFSTELTQEPDLSFGKYEGEYAITQVWAGKQVLLLVQINGYVTICDSSRLIEVLDRFDVPYIVIHLNSIVNEVFRTIGAPEQPVTSNVETLLATSLESRLPVKEKQILSIIRDNAYSEITMTKKDKGKIIVRAGREYDVGAGTTLEMILQRLTTGDFKDVSVKKRNGSIVSYTEVTTFKI